ncbi:unnamed protein product [Pieris macdunnoughi]|uniref:Uncharacterized protein n=1 Tax=Pieris macdunnoughi TaxID=345717 RepID=A0A821XZY3_9NEOP|nr:unnamed protein product [Pieris macdunnoughi]
MVGSLVCREQFDGIVTSYRRARHKSYDTDEVLNGPEREQWKFAIQSEFRSFEDNDAWALVDIPHSGTVLGFQAKN